MAFNLEIKGLRELQAKIGSLPKDVYSKTHMIVGRGAQTWVRNAQRSAPVNRQKGGGNLRQGITYKDQSNGSLISWMVSSNALYSPYIEWGTITHVSVPGELSSYAIQFKGSGIRKTGGIIPRPFFFPQQIPVKKQVEKELAIMISNIK